MNSSWVLGGYSKDIYSCGCLSGCIKLSLCSAAGFVDRGDIKKENKGLKAQLDSSQCVLSTDLC